MGIELRRNCLKNNDVSEQGGAESGALSDKPSLDARLALLAETWPSLPESIRAAIVAMVRSFIP